MTSQAASDHVHAVCLGDGPHVLALGNLHLDHAYLRPWLDGLADFATVVFVDLSGTGRSASPATTDELNHDTWLADIDRVRDRLSLPDRIVLFGHSYGGFLAQEYALRHPERLSGVILCSTAPALDYPELILANARESGNAAALAATERLLSGPAESDAHLQELWNTMLPLYFHHYDPEVAEIAFGDCRFTSAPWNQALTACLPAFNTAADLHALEIPVLAIGGRHDWLTPVEQGVGRIASLVQDAELVVFEESGHFPFIEEHTRFVEVVASWMAQLSAPD